MSTTESATTAEQGLIIRGVPVKFPNTPYPCQISYMDKVIDAIEKSQNALLESPTGTGKTLCLLCSTLAWQQSRPSSAVAADRQLLTKPNGNNGSNMNAFDTSGMNPVIIYATRTHNQLTQVVSELRRTAYRPRMAILGSRDQLCIHEKVSKLRGSALNHKCNSLVAHHSCLHKNNFDSYAGANSASSENEVLDIEDLVKVGKTKRVCPYYYSRDASTNSEIVFMPYNYLLDSSIRKTLKIDLSNSIVIFDEAHNLETVAADAMSFSLSSADIAASIQELQQVLRTLQNEMFDQADSSTYHNNMMDLSEVQRPDMAAVAHILTALFDLERAIDSVTLQNLEYGDGPGASFPGVWLTNMFQSIGLNNEMYVDELYRCKLMLLEEAEAALSGTDFGENAAPSHAAEPKVTVLAAALARVMMCMVENSSSDYRVYICEAKIKQFQPRRGNSGYQHQQEEVPTSGRKKRIVNFWCFSTGVALNELKRFGVRSIIITSGTLSPMEAVKEDMKIPFMAELINPHIVKEKQIFVSAMGTGVMGQTLNSSFNTRDNATYKDELGNTILSICYSLTKGPVDMVKFAEGGVLAFFPSYSIMEKTIERWRVVGIYERLESVMKVVMTEERGASNFNKHLNKDGAKNKKKHNFMLDGGNNASDPGHEHNEEEATNSLVAQFDEAILQQGRCLLLAVCRGKVSEGIDFSNNKGRVVIITGIPFAPHLDPKVVLKKEYLNDRSAGKQPAIAAAPFITASSKPPIVVQTASYAEMKTEHDYETSNMWAAASFVQGSLGDLSMSKALAAAPVVSVAVAQPLPAAVVQVPMQKMQAISKFTGQMWYNQSASRAVNQSLGRVIRHRFDWGAIFLLDERFQYDGQISQLSSWLRPRVRKSQDFKQTMQQFEGFVTEVNADLELRYDPVKVIESSEQFQKRQSIRLEVEKQEKDPFEKFIEVSATQLANGDITYISSDMIRNVSNNNDTAEMEAFLATLEDSKPKVLESTIPQDLTSLISKMQRNVAVKKSGYNAADDTGQKGLSLQSKMGQVLARKPSLNDRPFSFAPPQPNNVSSSSLSQTQMLPPSSSQQPQQARKFGASSSVDAFSTKSWQSKPDASSSLPNSQSTLKFSQPSQLFSSSQSQSKGKGNTAEQREKDEKKKKSVTALETLLTEIRPILGNKSTIALQLLMTNLKEQGGLTSTSQITSFLTELMKVISSLSTVLRRKTVLGMAHLIQDDAILEKYFKAAKELFSKLPGGKRPFSTSGLSQGKLPSRNVIDLIGNENIEDMGSKRAREMLQRSIKPASASSGNSISGPVRNARTVLAHLKALELPGQLSLSKSKADSTKSTCSICKESTDVYRAAVCGHVCCRPCWLRMTKGECPFCRQSFTVAQLESSEYMIMCKIYVFNRNLSLESRIVSFVYYR